MRALGCRQLLQDALELRLDAPEVVQLPCELPVLFRYGALLLRELRLPVAERLDERIQLLQVDLYDILLGAYVFLQLDDLLVDLAGEDLGLLRRPGRRGRLPLSGP